MTDSATVKRGLTRACAVAGVIGLACAAAAEQPAAAGTSTPGIVSTPAPTATPAPGDADSPADAVKETLEEGHEKSEETLKGAADAVKEGAEKAAEGAKEVVEDPAEAAKKAAEAAAARTKEAALSFRTDMHHWPERLWIDIKAIPSVHTAVVLGGASTLAGISHEKWDEDIERDVARHPDRFGSGQNNFLDEATNPYMIFAGSSIVYGTSLFFDSPALHDFSLDMMSALTIDMPIVFALKKAFDTTRPNGDPEGFPSGHVVGAMTLAALLQDHFGLYPALAGYTFAGLVAWHRLDFGKHHLSDVIFGGALGWVVGHAVGETQELPIIDARLVPMLGGTRTAGLGLEWRF